MKVQLNNLKGEGNLVMVMPVFLSVLCVGGGDFQRNMYFNLVNMEFFFYSIALDPAQNVSTGSWKPELEIKQRPTQGTPLGGTLSHTQNCSQHRVLESSFPSPFKAIRQMPLPLHRSNSTDFPELTLPMSSVT